MANITYRNVPYDLDGPGVVIIRDSWPEWQRSQWLEILRDYRPDPPPWVPSFLVVIGTDTTTSIQFPIWSGYFADSATAQWLANKYGNGGKRQVPFGGAGGNFTVSQQCFEINLKDGRWINAGILAQYYVREPMDTKPGAADQHIRALLGIGNN